MLLLRLHHLRLCRLDRASKRKPEAIAADNKRRRCRQLVCPASESTRRTPVRACVQQVRAGERSRARRPYKRATIVARERVHDEKDIRLHCYLSNLTAQLNNWIDTLFRLPEATGRCENDYYRVLAARSLASAD